MANDDQNNPQLAQHRTDLTYAFAWAFCGLVVSTGAYGLIWSKSFGPIGKLFFSFEYEMLATADQARTDLNINNGSPIYGTGPWDIMTVLIYAVIMILCFNSLCFLIEQFVVGVEIEEAAITIRLFVNVIVQATAFVAIVYCMIKGPFNMGLVWSGFPGYIPYTSKMIMLCLIAYALNGLFNVAFFQNLEARPVPAFKEMIYTTVICSLSYLSLLIPFGYIIILVKSLLDIMNNISLIAENIAPGSPLVWLFNRIFRYGSVAVHGGVFILSILLCCWAQNSTVVTKVTVVTLTTLSLALEIATLVLVLTDTDDQAMQGDRVGRGKKQASSHKGAKGHAGRGSASSVRR